MDYASISTKQVAIVTRLVQMVLSPIWVTPDRGFYFASKSVK